MPPASDFDGMHYLGVAPVRHDAGGEAIIEREHLRFAPEFGGTNMSPFAGNPEGILNTDGDFLDADILSFGDSEGWTYYDSMGDDEDDWTTPYEFGEDDAEDWTTPYEFGDIPSMDDVYAESLGRRKRKLKHIKPKYGKKYVAGKVSRKGKYIYVFLNTPVGVRSKNTVKKVAKGLLKLKKRIGKLANTSRPHVKLVGLVPVPSPIGLPVPAKAWRVRFKMKKAAVKVARKQDRKVKNKAKSISKRATRKLRALKKFKSGPLKGKYKNPIAAAHLKRVKKIAKKKYSKAVVHGVDKPKSMKELAALTPGARAAVLTKSSGLPPHFFAKVRADAKPAIKTMVLDALVAERAAPQADRGAVAEVSNYKQLSAEQEQAEEWGIPQDLPLSGLTYPGGGGESYDADPAEDSWAEQGEDQARYDSAVANLLADKFGDDWDDDDEFGDEHYPNETIWDEGFDGFGEDPYGTTDTNWDGADAAIPELYEEEQLWNSAFGAIPSMENPLAESLGEDENGIPSMADPMAESLGWLVDENQAGFEVLGGDVYDEGSGILYDGYQDERPMSVAQLHALPDPADVLGDIPSMDDVYAESLGEDDPYDDYFGAGNACSC